MANKQLDITESLVRMVAEYENKMGRRVSSKKAGHSLVNSEPLLADKGMEMKGKSTEL